MLPTPPDELFSLRLNNSVPLPRYYCYCTPRYPVCWREARAMAWIIFSLDAVPCLIHGQRHGKGPIFETVFNRELLCRPVRHGNILRNAPDETTMRLDKPIRLCAQSFTSESRVVEMTRRHCVVCATSKVPHALSDSLRLLLQSHARTHSCTHAGALRQ